MSRERTGRTNADGTIRCPKCRGEMHPMFLYEDKEPDVWLCFNCGHLVLTQSQPGAPIPSVDQ